MSIQIVPRFGRVTEVPLKETRLSEGAALRRIARIRSYTNENLLPAKPKVAKPPKEAKPKEVKPGEGFSTWLYKALVSLIPGRQLA